MTDIEVTPNGPYAVHGLPLIRLTLSPDPEPRLQEWVERESVDVSGEADGAGTYWLCRCGGSENKPFCDGHHRSIGFDGTESAATQDYRTRARVLPSADGVVRDVPDLCEHATFCTTPDTHVWRMVHSTDPQVRQAMAPMIDHCPSGRLTRAPDEHAADTELALPLRVAVVDDGPYLVTGMAVVTRADGAPCEVRNRVTLCRCGASSNKPFCDGSHAKVGFHDS